MSEEEKFPQVEGTSLATLPQKSNALASMELMAAIPEEELWLQDQRSPHTRRAYKEDAAHFMQTFGIATRKELRATSRAAVIAWVRKMQEDEEKPRTVCRRLSALSSLFRHLIEQHQATANPVDGVKPLAVSGETGVTAAFDTTQARLLLDSPNPTTLLGIRDRAILSALLQAGPRRAEVAKMKVKDFQINNGYPSLRYVRKGGKQHSVTLHSQTAQRITEYLKKSGHEKDLDGPLFRPVRPSWKLPNADERRHLDPDLIDRLLRIYVKHALGLARGFSAHSCRSTFATTALENKCPLEDVQKALGHADSRTTKLHDKRGDNPERSATFDANY